MTHARNAAPDRPPESPFQTRGSQIKAELMSRLWPVLKDHAHGLREDLEPWGESNLPARTYNAYARLLTRIEGLVRRMLVLLALSCRLPALSEAERASCAGLASSKPAHDLPLTRSLQNGFAPFRLSPRPNIMDDAAGEFNLLETASYGEGSLNDLGDGATERLDAPSLSMSSRPAGDLLHRAETLLDVFANPGHHTGRMANYLARSKATNDLSRHGTLRWGLAPADTQTLGSEALDSDAARLNSEVHLSLIGFFMPDLACSALTESVLPLEPG